MNSRAVLPDLDKFCHSGIFFGWWVMQYLAKNDSTLAIFCSNGQPYVNGQMLKIT